MTGGGAHRQADDLLTTRSAQAGLARLGARVAVVACSEGDGTAVDAREPGHEERRVVAPGIAPLVRSESEAAALRYHITASFWAGLE